MAPIQKLTQNLPLPEILAIERGLIRESLKENNPNGIFQTSEISTSEIDGYFFQFFSEEGKKMIEFHQNKQKEILLIFFNFDGDSNEYKSTGQWQELKFTDFDEAVSTSYFHDLFIN